MLQKKERNSGIELYKCLAIIMIVIRHCQQSLAKAVELTTSSGVDLQLK